jgi:hypothetical protein
LFSTFFAPPTELPRTLLRAATVRGAADPATLLLSAEAPVPAPGRAAAEAGTEGLGLVVVADADPLLVGLVTPAVEALVVFPRTELVRGGGRAVVVVLRRGADTPVPVPVAPLAAREDEAVERVRVDTRGFAVVEPGPAEAEVAGVVVEGLVSVDGFVVGFVSGLRAVDVVVEPLVAGTVLLAARREAVLAVSLEEAAVGAAPVEEVGFSFEAVGSGRRKAGREGFKLALLVVVVVVSVVGGLEPVGFGEVAEVSTSAASSSCGTRPVGMHEREKCKTTARPTSEHSALEHLPDPPSDALHPALLPHNRRLLGTARLLDLLPLCAVAVLARHGARGHLLLSGGHVTRVLLSG